MRWLLHGNLTPAVGAALQRHGHDVRLPADVELAPDGRYDEVLAAATKHQLEIITADDGMATAPFADDIYFARCVVYLHAGPGDVEQDDAVDRLFKRYKRLTPARLYTVTEGRVKIRQLPGHL